MSTKTPAEKAAAKARAKAAGKSSTAPKGSDRYKREQKEITSNKKSRFGSSGNVSNNRVTGRDNPSFTMNGKSMRKSGLDKIREERKGN